MRLSGALIFRGGGGAWLPKLLDPHSCRLPLAQRPPSVQRLSARDTGHSLFHAGRGLFHLGQRPLRVGGGLPCRRGLAVSDGVHPSRAQNPAAITAATMPAAPAAAIPLSRGPANLGATRSDAGASARCIAGSTRFAGWRRRRCSRNSRRSSSRASGSPPGCFCWPRRCGCCRCRHPG